jgi:hypothetical protein
MFGRLQAITINNIKEKTYTQLISGSPVCGAGFWCRISAWHGEYLLMLRDAYVAVNRYNTAVCDRSQKLPASLLQQWAAYPLFQN